MRQSAEVTKRQGHQVIEHVAFLFAMDVEAAPFIQQFMLKEVERSNGKALGVRAFQGRCNTLNITASLNGYDPKFGVDSIGTESAALNTFLTLQEFCPQLVISAGTAGGFASRGAAIGDVFLGESVVLRHDHRIALPGFREYGIGSFPVTRLRRLASLLGVKSGICSTGNSLDLTEYEANFMRENNVSVKDMEAAAVARLCELGRIPFNFVKAVTDFADAPDNHDQFLSNYTCACENLGSVLHAIVQYLAAGRTLEEL